MTSGSRRARAMECRPPQGIYANRTLNSVADMNATPLWVPQLLPQQMQFR
jgi:hypothetical protein